MKAHTRNWVVGSNSVNWIELDGTIIIFVNNTTTTKVFKVQEVD